MAKVMVLLYKSKYLRRGRFAPPRLRAEVALRFRSGRASAQTFLFSVFTGEAKVCTMNEPSL